MRSFVFLVLGSFVLVACSSDKAKEHKLRRKGDSTAVVVVGKTPESSGLSAEKEPNDTSEQAQVVVVAGPEAEQPSGVEGTLVGHLDVDRYQISLAEEGLLFVNLSRAEDADLKLEVLDQAGKRLALSDRGPAKTSEGIAGYWLAAGTPYQVVVSEFTKRKLRKKGFREGESKPYHLHLSVQIAGEGYEQEPNERLDGAMEIAADEERSGYIGWKDDTDLWRLAVVSANKAAESSKRSALHIAVSGIPKVTTKLSLLDADGKELTSVRAKPGEETAIRNFVPAQDADFYLVKVSAKRSNPDTPYRLSVSSAEISDGSEAEPNDTLATASVLATEDGALVLASGDLSLGDVDMYRIPAAQENRILDVRLDGKAGVDFSVAIVAESGAKLAIAEGAPSGVGEVLDQVNVAPGAAVIVVVKAKSAARPTSYSFSVSILPGTSPALHPSMIVPEIVPKDSLSTE